MGLFDQLQSGTRLYDNRTGCERLVDKIETRGQVVFLSFRNPQNGAVERQPFSAAEVESRFEIVQPGRTLFRAQAGLVALAAEAHRLKHGYLFNPLFATETSLIDLLPHQLAAVYGAPGQPGDPGQTGMLDLPRLRFLLADDAGAGKTVMAGLLIREMLLRRQARRVLVVSPAGLIGNWEKELRILFRLRFRLLSSADVSEAYNPFTDPRSDLAIVSLDTLWHDKMRSAYLDALAQSPPYDLVIFDEAHKLSANFNSDLTVDATNRYQMAEIIARQGRHLLLMSATPHMGKDDPYYFLWRLLEPDLFSTHEAFRGLDKAHKRRYLLRRMKEEMTDFNGKPLFVRRSSATLDYPLSQGPGSEQDLYDQVTRYCETHFDRAKQRNCSAAGLAMSILQRRLASSSWALYNSMRNREQKLTETLAELESSQAAAETLERLQRPLPVRDVRDAKTGDEEDGAGGREEAEIQDEASGAATDAQTIEEVRAEIEEVQHLARLAWMVYNRRQESKYERLVQALEDYPGEKVLIFTEFRDTLNFLIDRLEERGLTNKIAQIHGGMDFKQRTCQADKFRDPNGARLLIATDAAGEGINLQFCWLLVNYDIPWNPARLEQRMGRVHRYKQQHDVTLVNLVSADTREGRVLKALLDKLEAIRRELDDKVFDIIGQALTGKPLSELIFEAVVEGKERQALQELERSLTKEQVQKHLADAERKVEVSEVRALLQSLNKQKEIAEQKRMMPAYMRRFFYLAAPFLGMGLRGDIEGLFEIDPCPPAIRQALAAYPPELQTRLTFGRGLAMPALGSEPQAIYLHPGEPVFDTVMDLFLGQYDHLGLRGAVFEDPESREPYLFTLARAAVLREPANPAEAPEVTDEFMVGLRRFGNGQMELAPAHLLLTLFEGPGDAEPPAALVEAASDPAQSEAFLLEQLVLPALEKRRRQEEERLPDQVEQMRVAYNLRQAELLRQRRLLKEAVANAVPAAASKLRACNAEVDRLDNQRRQAEAALYAAPERLRLGPVSLYVQALVTPTPEAERERRRDANAEQVALAEVRRRETDEGSTIEDVSAPHLKSGFDWIVRRADGSIRYVEVKGRSGQPAVTLEQNEWAQAANHPDRYWLYVVYDCDTLPVLRRIPDPFANLLAENTGAVRINASEIKKFKPG